jgi:hypothetical protein
MEGAVTAADQGEQLFAVEVVAIRYLGPLVMVVYYWKGEF